MNRIEKNHNNAGIDLFLLDIAIPDNVNAGIDIGKQIVADSRYTNTPIIYITANPNAVFEAINKTHCYQFLEKPFHKKDLISAITTILENNKVSHDNYINIEANGKRFRLVKNDIAIIESMNHDVTVWTRSDAIVIRNYSLKQMLDNLDETFFQCHKSYIVSKNYVKLIDMGKSEIITIVAGKAIPIGRAFKKNL